MSSTDSQLEPLTAVVARAHRRAAVQLFLRESLVFLSVALLGLAALLSLGSGWFPQWAFGVFCLLGLAAAGFRWTRSRPDAYQIAQRLDSTWATEDQISTAYYFLENPQQAGPLASEQRRRAAGAASSGDVSLALPYRLPHAAYSAAALLLLNGALLGVRFGSTPVLPLQSPLPIAARWLVSDDPGREELASDQPPPDSANEEAGRGKSLRDQAETVSAAQRKSPEVIRATTAEGDEAEADLPLPKVEGLSAGEEYGDELASATESGEAASRQASGDLPAREMAASDPLEASDSGPAERSADPAGGASDDLLSRLQEAFRNMLSAFNLDPPSGGRQAGGKDSQGEETAKTAQAADSGQAGEAENSSASEGGSEAQTPDSASAVSSLQTASGASGEGQQQRSAEEGVATAGSAEGSKETAAAAQMETLGQIAELYNRRAAEMKGEVMIETQSAQQELETPYRPSDAVHTDRGGMVSRDEIPLAYRAFIQAYFEQIRQQSQK